MGIIIGKIYAYHLLVFFMRKIYRYDLLFYGRYL